MDSLPPEIIKIVTKFALVYATYKSLRLVSKKFHAAVEASDPPTKSGRLSTYVVTEMLGGVGWLSYTPIGTLHGISYQNYYWRHTRWILDAVRVTLYDRGTLLRRIDIKERPIGPNVIINNDTIIMRVHHNAIETRNYTTQKIIEQSDDELYELFYEFDVSIYNHNKSNGFPIEIINKIINYAYIKENYCALRAVNMQFYWAIRSRDPPIMTHMSDTCLASYTPIGILHGPQFHSCYGKKTLEIYKEGKFVRGIEIVTEHPYEVVHIQGKLFFGFGEPTMIGVDIRTDTAKVFDMLSRGVLIRYEEITQSSVSRLHNRTKFNTICRKNFKIVKIIVEDI